MPFVASQPERYHGKPHGTGHCVALVREAAGAPITTQWRRGDPVQGSNVAPGTAIATFDSNGRYGNHTDGRSHAAILLAQYDDGSMLVLDQWVGQDAAQRVIKHRKGAGDAANDASRFYIVEMET
jgi:hypothetical protein